MKYTLSINTNFNVVSKSRKTCDLDSMLRINKLYETYRR